MRAISILALSNDAIRAAVIADPYSAHPTIKHFQVFPLPNGTVVDGEVVIARFRYDGVNRRILKAFDTQAPANPDGLDLYEHVFLSGQQGTWKEHICSLVYLQRQEP